MARCSTRSSSRSVGVSAPPPHSASTRTPRTVWTWRENHTRKSRGLVHVLAVSEPDESGPILASLAALGRIEVRELVQRKHDGRDAVVDRRVDLGEHLPMSHQVAWYTEQAPFLLTRLAGRRARAASACSPVAGVPPSWVPAARTELTVPAPHEEPAPARKLPMGRVRLSMRDGLQVGGVALGLRHDRVVELFQAPNMIRDARLHRRGHAQRAYDVAQVVVDDGGAAHAARWCSTRFEKE